MNDPADTSLSGLFISPRVTVPLSEIDIRAVRARGPGGQHVNKSATAVQLRFDVGSSSLPEPYKRRLLQHRDSRINREGVVVIKSQAHRSQDRNRKAALNRLRELIQSAGRTRKTRVPTKPGPGARQRRMDDKTKRGRIKALRKKVDPDDR